MGNFFASEQQSQQPSRQSNDLTNFISTLDDKYKNMTSTTNSVIEEFKSTQIKQMDIQLNLFKEQLENKHNDIINVYKQSTGSTIENLKHENTELKKHVSITDFRSFKKAPTGNRFLVYSLFPEAVVSAKIRFDDLDKETVIVSIGHSIFNRNCNVNVGLMLSDFEGGGHRGAGACSFHVSKADFYIPKIIEILIKNESNEPKG